VGVADLRAHAVWHACWFVGILNDHLGLLGGMLWKPGRVCGVS